MLFFWRYLVILLDSSFFVGKEAEAMGFKTTLQLINRKNSQQWYVNFPSACAQMMNFQKGEVVEWEITPRGELMLKRPQRREPTDER